MRKLAFCICEKSRHISAANPCRLISTFAFRCADRSISLASMSEISHYVNVSVLIKFSQKTSVFTLIIIGSP